MDESASDIILNSRANATKYRQVEMTPIMIDPVRREQQRQDVRNAIIADTLFTLYSHLILTFFNYLRNPFKQHEK